MFETVFRMAASGSPRGDRRWRSVPVSLLLHGIVLGGVALVSARAVKESLEPPPPMIFLQGNAPPLPLGETAATNEAPKKEVIPVTLEQPEVAQPDPPSAAETTHDESAGEESSSSSQTPGDPNGKKDGVPTGVSGSEGRDGPGIGDSERPFVPGGDVVEPKLLYKVEPLYPETARKLHLEGTAVLQAIIGVSGRVEEVQVVHSAGALLDASAVRAVEQWRYRAATLTGRPVRCYLTVTVVFQLH